MLYIFYNFWNCWEKKFFFNYFYFYCIVCNFVAVVNVLYNSGYVIGDVNELNILVIDIVFVILVDMDLF